MKATYFLEVLSSWCHWAEPAWNEVRAHFAGRVAFDWKIALMNRGDFPTSREQCDWFYRRSGTITRSTYMLNSAWLEPELKGDYAAPNLVAEAGRDFGFTDDRLRIALSRAAMFDGRKIGRMEESVSVGATVMGVSEPALRARAESQEVRDRLESWTTIFHAHQISQRPSFLLEDEIGDKVVISGLWTAAPIIAAIEAMLSDSAAYASHRVHWGNPPST